MNAKQRLVSYTSGINYTDKRPNSSSSPLKLRPRSRPLILSVDAAPLKSLPTDELVNDRHTHIDFIVGGTLVHNAPVLCMVIDVTNFGDVTLYSGLLNGKIHVWELSSLSRIHIMSGHTDGVNCIVAETSMIPVEEKVIVSGGRDKCVRVWSPLTCTTITVLRGHTAEVKCVAVTGSLIFSGSADFMVWVWDKATFNCIQILPHGSTVTSLVYNNCTLITAAKDRQLRMWRVADPTHSSLQSISTSVAGSGLHSGPSTSGSSSNAMKEREKDVKFIKEKSIIAHLDTPEGICLGAAVSSYKLLYSIGKEGDIKEWDPQGLELCRHIKGAHPHQGVSITLTEQVLSRGASNPSMIVSGGDRGEVTVWDSVTLNCLRQFVLHKGPVTCLLSTDWTLFTGSKDGCVKVIDLRNIRPKGR